MAKILTESSWINYKSLKHLKQATATYFIKRNISPIVIPASTDANYVMTPSLTMWWLCREEHLVPSLEQLRMFEDLGM